MSNTEFVSLRANASGRKLTIPYKAELAARVIDVAGCDVLVVTAIFGGRYHLKAYDMRDGVEIAHSRASTSRRAWEVLRTAIAALEWESD